MPPVPQSLAETGLPGSLIEQLILKFLYFSGDMVASDLSRMMGLRFSLIEDMIEGLKTQMLVQVKSSKGYGPVSALLSFDGNRPAHCPRLPRNQSVRRTRARADLAIR